MNSFTPRIGPVSSDNIYRSSIFAVSTHRLLCWIQGQISQPLVAKKSLYFSISAVTERNELSCSTSSHLPQDLVGPASRRAAPRGIYIADMHGGTIGPSTLIPNDVKKSRRSTSCIANHATQIISDETAVIWACVGNTKKQSVDYAANYPTENITASAANGRSATSKSSTNHRLSSSIPTTTTKNFGSNESDSPKRGTLSTEPSMLRSKVSRLPWKRWSRIISTARNLRYEKLHNSLVASPPITLTGGGAFFFQSRPGEVAWP